MLPTFAFKSTFAGQAMVLPMGKLRFFCFLDISKICCCLENKMKTPARMLGPFGVLGSGMSLVTIVYALCGFVG